MMTWSRCGFLVVCGCLAAMLTLAGPGQAQRLITGTNVIEPSTSPEKQDALVQALKVAGVGVVRTHVNDLTGADGDKRLGFVERLAKVGIKVDLIVKPQFPADAIAKPASKGSFGGYGLSQADPQLSLAYYRQLFTALDENHVELAALELGNELNARGFNPDFPMEGDGVIWSADDLEHGSPQARVVGKGFVQYVKVMAALKQARDASRLNRQAQLISFGTATTQPVGRVTNPKSIFAHTNAVDPNEALKFLRAHGLDREVDGYGVHWYGSSAGNVAPALQQALSPCGVNGGKPCWMTEWGGVDVKDQTCPFNGDAQAAKYKAVMDVYRQYAKQGRLAAALVFDWGAPVGSTTWDPAGIYQCGGLTKAGKVALSR